MASALGDLTYRGATVWKRLVGNITTTRKFLRQVGNGTVSAAPAWDQVTDADLSVSDITTNNVTTSAHGFTPKAPNDVTKFLRGDATWASGDTIVRKTSDEGIAADTTLSNDAALTFAVEASAVYDVEVTLVITSGNATSDVKLAWSLPASTTMYWGLTSGTLGVTEAWHANDTAGVQTQILTEGATLTFGSVTGTHVAWIKAVIMTAGTSGNATVQWAQDTSDAATTTVKANSFIRYRKIS